MSSAIDSWQQRVERHYRQSIKTQKQQAFQPAGDVWQPLASPCRGDLRRAADPIVERICRMVRPEATVLDVGGGAGRYALPLALRCRHVTVVEPSAGMAAELRDGARKANINNISVIESTWQEANTDSADLALCADLVHQVAEIGPFIRKLESHANEQALVVAYAGAPLSQLTPFWRTVHGVDRVELPAAPEFLNVLREMNIHPAIELFDAEGAAAFPSRHRALEFFRRFLYVTPGSLRDQHLRTAMNTMVMESPDGFTSRGTQGRRPALISWAPSTARSGDTMPVEMGCLVGVGSR